MVYERGHTEEAAIRVIIFKELDSGSFAPHLHKLKLASAKTYASAGVNMYL